MKKVKSSWEKCPRCEKVKLIKLVSAERISNSMDMKYVYGSYCPNCGWKQDYTLNKWERFNCDTYKQIKSHYQELPWVTRKRVGLK